MPPVASQQLAERYQLQLDAGWRQWFDEAHALQLLSGRFCSPIAIDELTATAPPDIWPGFMLPDTLPVVSNDYGDWWCIRIGSDNGIEEIIQWSHGGGDWLPIGQSMGQAVLWDHIEQFRHNSIEAQHAAHEYPARTPSPDGHALPTQQVIQWLAGQLTVDSAELDELFSMVRSGHYQQGLETMLKRDWSISATACELIEIALQGQLAQLADNKLAARCGMNWTPDFTRWLFDTDHISVEARHLLSEYSPGVRFQQDWATAEHLAHHVAARRDDLAWPTDIAGWSAERRGDLNTAADRYFEGRYSSAFTDQSVRLRSHWFAERMGKFAAAQLHRLQPHLPDSMRDDPYLQMLWHEDPARLRSAVRGFWLQQARNAFSAENFGDAYRYYLHAGWDLGAERMSDYVEIMDGLMKSATLAGWTARASVIAAHAECLRKRLVNRL